MASGLQHHLWKIGMGPGICESLLWTDWLARLKCPFFNEIFTWRCHGNHEHDRKPWGYDVLGQFELPGWKCQRALNRGSVGFVIAWILTPVVCRFSESRGRLLSILWAKTAAHFESEMIPACQLRHTSHVMSHKTSQDPSSLLLIIVPKTGHKSSENLKAPLNTC